MYELMWSGEFLVAFTLMFVVFKIAQSQTIRETDAMKRVKMHDNDGFIALPDVIIEDISRRLKIIDALALRCTCQTFLPVVGESCDERVKMQYNTVIQFFPMHVIRSLPMTVWLQVEWIDFDPKWVGSTYYIDNIQHADIRGSPFRCCYDQFGRLALILRRHTDIAVLFQRYTDNINTWTFASKSLPIGGCRLCDSMVARLALWLSHDYADFPLSQP